MDVGLSHRRIVGMDVDAGCHRLDRRCVLVPVVDFIATPTKRKDDRKGAMALCI